MLKHAPTGHCGNMHNSMNQGLHWECRNSLDLFFSLASPVLHLVKILPPEVELIPVAKYHAGDV